MLAIAEGVSAYVLWDAVFAGLVYDAEPLPPASSRYERASISARSPRASACPACASAGVSRCSSTRWMYIQYNTQHAIGSGSGMSVRHALLALLSEGPKYGLQLREEFEARTGEVWPLNVGQVYATLQRLERDGLVESDDDEDAPGPQKGFRITGNGAEELAKWLRTPPDLASPPRDELVIKILVAIRLPGVDVHEVIQSHRRYLVELMQQWTRLKDEEAPLDLNLALVLDAELYRLDSVVQWLDTADGRLKRAGPGLDPPPTARQQTAAPLRRRIGVRR
jgi:DNA-binding PadR family transcriptional regulator